MATLVDPQHTGRLLKQSEGTAARRRIPVYLSLAGAPVTGQGSWTGSEILVSTNGGTFGNFAGTMTEVGNGWYHYEFTSGELGNPGFILARFARAAIDTVTVSASIVVWDWNTVTNGRPDVNIGSCSNDVITAAAIADNAIDNGAMATGAVTAKALGHITSSVNGTATTTVIPTNLTQSSTNHFKDAFFKITSGTLLGACKRISAYNGTTKEITLESALPSAPANAVTFEIIND
jgi:hypothetical protein